MWTLIGAPCGKYLGPIMAPTLSQLEVFGELGKVADRLSPGVREQLVSMSPATIDRMLQPTKAARYPAAKSATRPGARCVPRWWCARAWTRWSRLQGSLRSIWSLTAGTASRVSRLGL